MTGYPHDLIAAIRASAQSLADAADALNSDFAPADRTTRFLHRLDITTSTMSADGKRHFLRALLDAWERRYARFICANEGDMDPRVADGDVDASDYLLTICGISQRLSEYEVRNDANNVEGRGGRDD